jgi:hypothetical protein
MSRLPIIGDMVQVKIPDVDRGKLDAPYLTTIVVEVSYKIIYIFLIFTDPNVVARNCCNASAHVL